LITYLAGPYTGATEDETQFNIASAERIAMILWNQGETVICPHLNTRNFHLKCKNADYASFVAGYIEIMLKCDQVILLPGWQSSRGAKLEYELAKKFGITVFDWDERMSRQEENDDEATG
jgi:hypothetical protein